MHISLKYLWIFLSILFIYSCKPTEKKDKRAAQVRSEMQSQMKVLRSATYFKDIAIRRYLKEEFEGFYKNRNYRMAWMTSDKILPQADSLFKTLFLAYEDGLDVDNYDVKELSTLQQAIFSGKKSRRDTLNLRKLVQLDFMMTSAYLTYGSHLLAGRIDPAKMDTSWITYPRKKDLSVHLEAAIKSNHIRESLQALSPIVSQYKQLKNQLAFHRRIVQKGGWPTIQNGKVPKKGESGEQVTALWKRLAISGDLDTSRVKSLVFNDQMEAAIKKFQERYGIKPDGKLNAQTIASLNRPVQNIIQLIELNMERIRWAPDSMGNTYLLVNVPEYVLKAFSNGKKEMEMRVIVGKEYASTPVFSDTLEYIVFSPDWTVPMSIVRKELLSMLQKDPDYLARQNMTVYANWDEADTTALDPDTTNWSQFTPETFNYRVVQKPGPQNPLGGVKFMLPNDLFIYLHDTPNDALFKRQERSFSHGCIRLEKPVELAAYLLKWDKKEAEENMNQPKPVAVDLEKKWPVQIVYRTAWIDERGLLNFREDIYGHDSKQLNAILKKETQLSKL